MTSIGDYVVYLVAKDVINSVVNDSVNYKISVKDRTLPVITLSKFNTTAKAGESFAIASYSVDKPNCVTFVTILTANGTYELVDGKTYTPKYKGVYVVTVTAFDDYGNIAHKDYTVTVK